MHSIDFHTGTKGILRGSMCVMIIAVWQAVRRSHQEWEGDDIDVMSGFHRKQGSLCLITLRLVDTRIMG